MRRPPCPQDNDRKNIDQHRNNNDDDDNHHEAVETNAGESDRDNCYLSPFDNTMIQYVVVAMVEWQRGEDLVFAGYLNVDLDRMGGRLLDEDIAVTVAMVGLEDISAHFLPRQIA